MTLANRYLILPALTNHTAPCSRPYSTPLRTTATTPTRGVRSCTTGGLLSPCGSPRPPSNNNNINNNNYSSSNSSSNNSSSNNNNNNSINSSNSPALTTIPTATCPSTPPTA